MRILVCGGRGYANQAALFHALDVLHAKTPITLIIEGGARGADRLARGWALSRGVDFVTEDADWTSYGYAAGPKRNKVMLDKHKPDGVVAFPGHKGTADMIDQAIGAGLKVWQPFKA